MRKLIFGFCLAIALFAVGCVHGPQGRIYSDVKVPQEATTNATGDKQGTACRQTILGLQQGGLLSFGDASIKTAADDGNISKISSVSRDRMNVLFFFSKDCTVVSGS